MEAGGCVDKYIQDQMIIFMALAQGESRLLCGPLTLHTETAIHIAEKMTGARYVLLRLVLLLLLLLLIFLLNFRSSSTTNNTNT